MINVTKATGEKEPFSEDKLRLSVKRAGIPQNLENQVINHVKNKLYDNIQTSQIYEHVMEFLGTTALPYSRTRYSLKRGIMDLGPTGFPFEDFVAKVLQTLGYKTTVRIILNGKCVNHEVDIITELDNKKSMIEAKFHNASGTRSDVHVSLYTKARFDDLKEKYNLDNAWIVTNTKFSSDALAYANCAGMRATSWNYPDGQSLRDLVERSRLHPLTVLTTLSQNQKQQLLSNRIVLCKDISTNPNSLSSLALSKEQLQRVIEESKFTCPT